MDNYETGIYTDNPDDTLRYMQSTEVVAVVRCKDCKHGRRYKYTDKYVECKMDIDPIDRDSDFFCADGERGEEDE